MYAQKFMILQVIKHIWLISGYHLLSPVKDTYCCRLILCRMKADNQKQIRSITVHSIPHQTHVKQILPHVHTEVCTVLANSVIQMFIHACFCSRSYIHLKILLA